jgi:hypothetical protein
VFFLPRAAARAGPSAQEQVSGRRTEHASRSRSRPETRRAHGRDSAHWRRLARLARDRDGACVICGSTENLSACLDPELEGRHDLATLQDVITACLTCRSRAGAPWSQSDRPQLLPPRHIRRRRRALVASAFLCVLLALTPEAVADALPVTPGSADVASPPSTVETATSPQVPDGGTSEQGTAAEQAASAEADASETSPVNVVVTVRIDSPGADGPVEQITEVVVAAAAENTAATTQAVSDSPDLDPTGDTSSAGATPETSSAPTDVAQSSSTNQAAGAVAETAPVTPVNVAVSVRINSPGDAAPVVQKTEVAAVGTADNESTVSQRVADSLDDVQAVRRQRRVPSTQRTAEARPDADERESPAPAARGARTRPETASKKADAAPASATAGRQERERPDSRAAARHPSKNVGEGVARGGRDRARVKDALPALTKSSQSRGVRHAAAPRRYPNEGSSMRQAIARRREAAAPAASVLEGAYLTLILTIAAALAASGIAAGSRWMPLRPGGRAPGE